MVEVAAFAILRYADMSDKRNRIKGAHIMLIIVK